jgi:hypothetical protein
MKMLDAFTEYLLSEGPSLKDRFDWSFSLKNCPVKNLSVVGGSAYEKTKNLRLAVYKELMTESPNNLALQMWYVRDWGKVKGNKESTLEGYVNTSHEKLIGLGKKGIATWSKILSIRQPNAFVVYDARVALALNSLQKKYAVKDRIFFELLPSQNKSFVQPTNKKIQSSDFFTQKPPSDFYLRYLDLMRNAALRSNKFDIQDAEMLLFSSAEELATIW